MPDVYANGSGRSASAWAAFSATAIDGLPRRIPAVWGRGWALRRGGGKSCRAYEQPLGPRSDPKNGDPAWFPYGRGPQGDQIRIHNYARGVRGGL